MLLIVLKCSKIRFNPDSSLYYIASGMFRCFNVSAYSLSRVLFFEFQGLMLCFILCILFYRSKPLQIWDKEGEFVHLRTVVFYLHLVEGFFFFFFVCSVFENTAVVLLGDLKKQWSLVVHNTIKFSCVSCQYEHSLAFKASTPTSSGGSNFHSHFVVLKENSGYWC